MFSFLARISSVQNMLCLVMVNMGSLANIYGAVGVIWQAVRVFSIRAWCMHTVSNPRGDSDLTPRNGGEFSLGQIRAG